MIASTHNRRTQDLGHPRGNEGGSRYITMRWCVGSDCSVPQPADKSPGLVQAMRNPLLRPRLGFHCCVNQNPWLPDAYLCLEGHVWVTECPFLLSALSWDCFVCRLLLCLKLFTLQRRLGSSVSQLCITLARVQLPPWKCSCTSQP